MGGFAIQPGTLEALKWLAFFCMAIDHMYKFTSITQWQFIYPIGRLAMPLFAFTFACSLSNLNLDDKKSVYGLLGRLLLCASIATLPYVYLQYKSGWLAIWPLNVVFMFLLAVLILFINQGKTRLRFLLGALLFVFGGLVVEFFWAGLLLVLFSYYFVKKPNWINLFFIVAALLWMADLNGNFVACLILPVAYLAQFLDLKFKRIKHVFYVLYPLHLLLLAGLKWLNF